MTQNYLLFETAQQLLALPAAVIAEVLPMVPLAPVPAMPPFLAGFLDWQDGSVPIPVLRLEQVLRLPHPAAVPGRHTPILVVRAARDFGLLVERVHALVLAESDSVETVLPEQSFNGCIVGLLPLTDGREASVLSVERLLLAEERERLEAFTLLAGERRTALDVGSTP